MIKKIILVLLIFSANAAASGDMGKVFFGKNLAKVSTEHTDRLYLKINDSEKLYFNRKHEGPVLEGLDLNKDYVVKVYFDDRIVQSWVLNFSKLKVQNLVIWRSAGAWRMEPWEGDGGR